MENLLMTTNQVEVNMHIIYIGIATIIISAAVYELWSGQNQWLAYVGILLSLRTVLITIDFAFSE